MPAAAAGAIFTAVGSAGAAVAGAVGVTSATGLAVAAGVAQGIVTGAVVGGASAAISGGSIGDGMLKGALFGGVTGGVATYFSPGLQAMQSASVAKSGVAGATEVAGQLAGRAPQAAAPFGAMTEIGSDGGPITTVSSMSNSGAAGSLVPQTTASVADQYGKAQLYGGLLEGAGKGYASHLDRKSREELANQEYERSRITVPENTQPKKAPQLSRVPDWRDYIKVRPKTGLA